MSAPKMFKEVSTPKGTYVLKRANAVDQKKLLLLVSGRVAANSHATGKEINNPLLKGMVMTLPETTFDEVARITLDQLAKAGEKNALTIDDFNGNMNLYCDLIAEGVFFNLHDFFLWLNEENTLLKESKKVPEKPAE